VPAQRGKLSGSQYRKSKAKERMDAKNLKQLMRRSLVKSSTVRQNEANEPAGLSESSVIQVG